MSIGLQQLYEYKEMLIRLG